MKKPCQMRFVGVVFALMAVFSAMTAAADTGCTASLSVNGQIRLHVPVINVAGTFLSADFVYVPTPGAIPFQLTGAGAATQGTCSNPATVVVSTVNGTSTVELFIPDVVFNGTSYRLGLLWEPGTTMFDLDLSALGANPFAQTDLAGTWDSLFFFTGEKSGWASLSFSVDNAGSVSVTSYVDNAGKTTAPASFSSIVLSIDNSNGVVTQGGSSGEPTFQGNMSSGKTLIVGTESNSTSYAIDVFRKRVASVTYSSADIANIQYAFNDLFSGGSSVWAYGTAQTDGSGHVTITSDNNPSGPVTPLPAGGALQIDPSGIITATNNTFHGIMSTDKKMIFSVETYSSTPTYRVAAFLLTGQTFTTADLAGNYSFHNLKSGASPGWGYGTFVTDTTGNQTYLTSLDSTGSTVLPASDLISIDPGGATTKASIASYHGQMSFNKDLLVRTQNQGTGSYGLAISIK